MDLKSIYTELITESIDQNKIINAVKGKRIITIYYKADREENEKEGWRRIEPFCCGINKFGNPVLRAWQVSGVSNSYPPGKAHDPLTHIPGWRMFRMDKIVSLITEPKTFNQIRPKYNPQDKDMVTIFAAVDFGGNQTGNEPNISPVTSPPVQVVSKPIPQQKVAPVQPQIPQTVNKEVPVVQPQQRQQPEVQPQVQKDVLPQMRHHTQPTGNKTYWDKLTTNFKRLINYRPKR